MNEEEWDHIEDLFGEYNPHFNGKEIEVPDFRKEEYYEAMKALKDAKMLALVGPRGVGKTTIMKQMMKELKDAFFFSFEREETRKRELMEVLIEAVIEAHIEYMFLDEVQFVEGWEEILHKYCTSEEVKLKVTISSSQSLSISKEEQRLNGILRTLYVNPLSFRDFLMMKGFELPDSIPEGMDEFSFLVTQYEKIDIVLMENLFREYLFKGAFPKLVNEIDAKVIRSYIEKYIVRKILYDDMPYIFEIRKPEKIYEMFQYISDNIGNIIAISALARELGINKRTVKKYLYYLSKTFLITTSQKYSEHPAKRTKKLKKIYTTHPSLAIQISGKSSEKLDDASISRYIGCLFSDEYFWKENGNEISIVYSDDSSMPLDIDYEDVTDIEHIKNLLRFMEKFDLDLGILLTKGDVGKLVLGGREIYLIPSWIILLL